MHISINGETRTLTEKMTIASLLGELELAPHYVAVEVNKQLIPRTQHTEYYLTEGDSLEIVTLVGGG